jgi:hypothetical protein
MAIEPKPLPSKLVAWVARQHSTYKIECVESEYVQCDAWNGSVYHFNLQRPGVSKAVSLLQGFGFALDQASDNPKWYWDFKGPMAPTATAAVLRALRNLK